MDKRYHRKNRRLPKFKLVSRTIISREKSFLEKHFPEIEVQLKGDKLICFGTTQPSSQCPLYKFRIEYDGFSPPDVFIVEPEIVYDSKIHLYPSNNSLCLYYPKEMPWNRFKHRLYETIIPWTLEWCVFYELYKITGVWEHPEIHF
ncbi:hypothetical protein JCM19296_44 [Nonlabens ulvanivorans]|uniref:Type II CBASS E2 protein domain-containing protein n=1 Tax=Nonlabens ulvanivorans TaxID=906888 RepID=A0A081D6C0_NONUL|nr:hypothetical protein JCM19296_44 [Nonlabens ulvanivorans]